MTYFRKKRAIAGGLTIAGSSLGGVIFPLMAVHLIPAIGFPWTMRACAFLIMGLLVITNLAVSSYLDHCPKPFRIAQYLAPMRETNYLLMCLASFFLYCTSTVLCLGGCSFADIFLQGGCSCLSITSLLPLCIMACQPRWPLI